MIPNKVTARKANLNKAEMQPVNTLLLSTGFSMRVVVPYRS